ncbi:MAG: ribonuclease P protein subunit [Candidatus Woesearchaeota archaeon]
MNMHNQIIHAEWIGTHIRVITAANKTQEGIEGTAVDETRNTIVVETPKGLKRVQKHGSVLEINGEEVRGDEVLAAPEERIKLKVNK